MKFKECVLNVRVKRPFTLYCKENGYELIDEYDQTSDLYTSKDLVDTLLVTNNSQGIIKKFLDFRYRKTSDISIECDYKDICSFVDEEKIIETLKSDNYEKTGTFIAKNTVYKKDSVKFNIIEHFHPVKRIELAIVGKKDEVNDIIFSLKNYIAFLGLK